LKAPAIKEDELVCALVVPVDPVFAVGVAAVWIAAALPLVAAALEDAGAVAGCWAVCRRLEGASAWDEVAPVIPVPAAQFDSALVTGETAVLGALLLGLGARTCGWGLGM
jgi:hypothetical protein